MNNLPSETITEIASYLHVRDRLECVCVSKRWKELITNTNLFETVKISGIANLIKAINFFDSRRELASTVKNLTINNCEMDAVYVLSLPGLFPNVKSFSWDEELVYGVIQYQDVDNDGIEYPTDIMCTHAFEKWNKIESEKEDCCTTRILPLMLKTAASSTAFSYLHQIEFSLKTAWDRYHNWDRLTDSLINILQSWSYAKQALPFVFDCDIFNDEPEEDDDSSDEAVTGWITYIGRKYANINHLEFDVDYNDEPSNNTRCPLVVEHTLVNMLSCLKKLKTYKNKAFPITNNIVTAMDKYNLKLNQTQLQLQNYMSQLSDYHSLLTSSTARNLKCLKAFSRGRNVEIDKFSSALAASSSNVINLVELNISNYSNGTLTSLITLLQNLKSLERLTYKRVNFKNSDENLDSQVNVIDGACNLKKLNWTLHQTETINLCFHMSGHISKCTTPGSALDLCLNNGQSPHLRLFSMEMNNDYYTFNDRPERVGKQYKDLNMIKEDDSVVNGYSINIMSTNSRVILDLWPVSPEFLNRNNDFNNRMND